MDMRSLLISALPLVVCLPVTATESPGNDCSLLSAAEVSSAIGKSYDNVNKSVAPRPFANTAQGTDCEYTSSKNRSQGELLFRYYVDPSARDASDLFARLGAFYNPHTPAAGIGDEAYIDGQHGLHVRKGKVRYFLQLHGTPDDKALVSLAGTIAGKL